MAVAQHKEKEVPLVLPLVDTFEYEWWLSVDTTLGDVYFAIREEYINARLSDVLMTPEIEVCFDIHDGQFCCYATCQSLFNNFVLSSAQYIARMLCAVFDTNQCNYRITNRSDKMPVSINYIEVVGSNVTVGNVPLTGRKATL